MRQASAIGTQFLPVVGGVSGVALALLPFGRMVAWLALVAAVWGVARRLEWDHALVAAPLAAWWFAFAYSRPRFGGVMADQGALRLAWLLLISALAAAAAARWSPVRRAGALEDRRSDQGGQQ